MNFFHVKPHHTGFFKTLQLGASGMSLLPVLKKTTYLVANNTQNLEEVSGHERDQHLTVINQPE